MRLLSDLAVSAGAALTNEEIAFDAVTTVKHHIESRRHTLKLVGLEMPVPVRADHVRLSQVLGNLFSNAANYTPVGGTIELSVTSV